MNRPYPWQEFTENPKDAIEVILEELRTCPDQQTMRANIIGLERLYQGDYVGATVPGDGSTVELSAKVPQPSGLLRFYKQAARQFSAVRQYASESAPVDDKNAFYAGELMMTHINYRLMDPRMRVWTLRQRLSNADEDPNEIFENTKSMLDEFEESREYCREHPSTRDVYLGLGLLAERLYADAPNRDEYVDYFADGARYAGRLLLKMDEAFRQTYRPTLSR